MDTERNGDKLLFHVSITNFLTHCTITYKEESPPVERIYTVYQAAASHTTQQAAVHHGVMIMSQFNT